MLLQPCPSVPAAVGTRIGCAPHRVSVIRLFRVPPPVIAFYRSTAYIPRSRRYRTSARLTGERRTPGNEEYGLHVCWCAGYNGENHVDDGRSDLITSCINDQAFRPINKSSSSDCCMGVGSWPTVA